MEIDSKLAYVQFRDDWQKRFAAEQKIPKGNLREEVHTESHGPLNSEVEDNSSNFISRTSRGLDGSNDGSDGAVQFGERRRSYNSGIRIDLKLPDAVRLTKTGLMTVIQFNALYLPRRLAPLQENCAPSSKLRTMNFPPDRHDKREHLPVPDPKDDQLLQEVLSLVCLPISRGPKLIDPVILSKISN